LTSGHDCLTSLAVIASFALAKSIEDLIMLQRPSSLVVLCAAVAAAYPFQQQVLQNNAVTAKDEGDFNVLHHLSGK